MRSLPQEEQMAKKAKKRTSRGRKQDRKRVAGGQGHEVCYEAKKTGKSKKAVKRGDQEGRAKPAQRRT
jgi:hypothetical protein